MNIETVLCGYLEENCYILNNESGDCIIIDPGDRATDIIKYINMHEFTLRAILITHSDRFARDKSGRLIQ